MTTASTRSIYSRYASHWRMPEVKYGVTTSKHQSVARAIVTNVDSVMR